MKAREPENNITLEHLVKKFSAPMYGLLKKIVHDDNVAQTVLHFSFQNIMQELNNYNSRHGSLFMWMTNIIRNTAIEYTSSKSVKMLNGGGAGSWKKNSFETRDRIEPSAYLSQILPADRVVWELSIIRGYNHSEISDFLKLSPEMVQKRLISACTALLKIMDEQRKPVL